MYFPRLLFIGFLFLVMSCGNDSSSNMSSTDSAVNSQTYPSHPIVWDVVTPETVGMNSSYLDSALDYAFRDGSYTQAVVVIKDGKLIAERYRGITDNEAYNLASELGESSAFYKNLYAQRDQNSFISSWSTAKSFTSFLVGIAIESGSIDSIDDFVSEYFLFCFETEKLIYQSKQRKKMLVFYNAHLLLLRYSECLM